MKAQDGDSVLAADDQAPRRQHQVSTSAAPDIEPHGLPERLPGIEIEEVQAFAGGPVDDSGGDESAPKAVLVLFSCQSLPGDPSAGDIECPERVARDNGSTVTDTQ